MLGHSPEETAEHYHISESTFYRILKSGIEHARFYSQNGEKSAKVDSE
ncbi:MAG: helix-turn-helix domain-containing protein [Acutalibacteraceae bacterium]